MSAALPHIHTRAASLLGLLVRAAMVWICGKAARTANKKTTLGGKSEARGKIEQCVSLRAE